MMTKKQRAVQLRDLVLKVLNTHRTQRCTGGGTVSLAIGEVPNRLDIFYRTPFHRLP
jgi:hypothetical protein